MTISSAGAGANCGHTYPAMAIPEVRIVMARKQAIQRQKDEKDRRMGYGCKKSTV
jgi:hypothetical protein